MEIHIVNEQDILIIYEDVLRSAVEAVLEGEGVVCSEMALFLIDDPKITALHKRYFNDPTPTDCISFPIDQPGPNSYLGDIFVSAQTAQSYALERGHAAEDELILYLVHGLLHLLGYDDIEEKEREVMRKKEKTYMERIVGERSRICSHS